MTEGSDGFTTAGPAMTAEFVRSALPNVLLRLGIKPPPPDRLRAVHATLRRRLATLGTEADAERVLRHALAPLAADQIRRNEPIRTREGSEDGGHDLAGLRAWAVAVRLNLDAPAQGRQVRTSPAGQAHRVLRVAREPLGLLSNGSELRLLISDPSLPDSHLAFPLDRWRDAVDPPAEMGLLLSLAGPQGSAALREILQAARLHQTRVTDELRRQARTGLELFLRAVHGLPGNPAAPADALWHDGLILIHRLLFVLKLEATDPARGFSFAATRLWRETLSPNLALGGLVRRHIDLGHDTGSMLETGLRQLFRACRDGLGSAELVIAPLGGMLFGADAMPVLDRMRWGERAVALLLDRLLWTTPAGRPRERVHYGALDVEVLGGVYESLLGLEPGIAPSPTAPLLHGRHARPGNAYPNPAAAAVSAGGFFLRSGKTRKASGSYYTPGPFVRFLVRETLGPACDARSPADDPDPAAILALNVVDPAVGSGHFLVEACRFLAEALLDACQRCHFGARDPATEPRRAATLRARIEALPDPDGLLASYLARGGIAEGRALAICRRMVAMHCLYGVDRNPLAIELAKLSLWLESHAEGLPLTFLDHRLLTGDSLAGPFLDDMRALPVGGGMLDPLLSRGLAGRLSAMHGAVLVEVRRIGATLGRDLSDLAVKQQARERLAAAQAPLLHLARAWSGAAMLADRTGDDEWQALARDVADTGAWPERLTPRQHAMLDAGREALPWDLAFPEVTGFDAVISNPPWDVIQHNTRDFVAEIEPAVFDAASAGARTAIERRVLADPGHAAAFAAYRADFDRRKRVAARLFRHQRVGTEAGSTAGNLDAFRLFAERAIRLAAADGAVGLLLPSAFHANDGSTGIRRLFMDNGLHTCLSFENRAGLFAIDSRFKFALVIARRPGPARAIRCAFYLRGLEDADDPARVMHYDRGFIRQSGGSRETLLELRGQADLAIARRMFAERETLAAWCARHRIRLGRDLHMTDDSHRFTPIDAAGQGPGWLVLHEGKTFHQFTDRREPAPRYAVHTGALTDKPRIAATAAHFRLAFRDIARSNDERSMIATMLPPGTVTGHTVTIEKAPEARPIAAALTLCAIFNSFPFDWLTRQKTATHLSLYLLEGLPMPALDSAEDQELADIAAALCAADRRFAGLVRADPVSAGLVSDVPVPADPVSAGRFPCVPDQATRRRLRARADALIARAYGLDRGEYDRLLAGFSHGSWPAAPAMCLSAWDSALIAVPRPRVLVEVSDAGCHADPR